MAILKKISPDKAAKLRIEMRRAEEEAYSILNNQGQHLEVNELDVRSVSVPALKLLAARESGDTDTEKLSVIKDLSDGERRIKEKMARGFNEEAGNNILAIGLIAMSTGMDLETALTNLQRKRI